MASGIYLNESVWSSPLVGYNKKQKRRSWTYLGKKNAAGSCYQKLHSYYQITTRCDIQKKKKKNNNKKGVVPRVT